MASEIERKFLVQGEGWRAGARQRLCQCYLNRDKEREAEHLTCGRKCCPRCKAQSMLAFTISKPLSAVMEPA